MSIQIAGSNGNNAPFAQGFRNEAIGALNGVNFENARKGTAFVYTIASQALLLSATTGGHPTVINPVGSGVIFVPVSLRVSFISGTTTISAVVLGTTLNVGGGAATAAPIATATLVAKKSAAIGGPGSVTGGCLWSPTTNTFTAAPVIDFATGINLGAVSPSAGSGIYSCDFNGLPVYYPGTAMSVCATVTTTTSVYTVTIIGLEVPLG